MANTIDLLIDELIEAAISETIGLAAPTPLDAAKLRLGVVIRSEDEEEVIELMRIQLPECLEDGAVRVLNHRCGYGLVNSAVWADSELCSFIYGVSDSPIRG